MNGVHPHKGVNTFQRSGLPLLYDRQYLIGYCAEGGGGDIYAVEFLKMVRYITMTHSKSIEGNDLIIKGITKIGLPLLYDLRLEAAVSVPWSFEFKGALLGSYNLRNPAIAPVFWRCQFLDAIQFPHQGRPQVSFLSVGLKRLLYRSVVCQPLTA